MQLNICLTLQPFLIQTCWLQITTTNKVSTLSIAKVKPEHAGNYTARLENVAGKSESTANLLAVGEYNL